MSSPSSSGTDDGDPLLFGSISPMPTLRSPRATRANTVAASAQGGWVGLPHSSRIPAGIGTVLADEKHDWRAHDAALNRLRSTRPRLMARMCICCTFALPIPLPDTVALQCRQASLEGTGEVRLRRLVKEALRMRPSRIIVGEVRQEECLDLLIALNSGLPEVCALKRVAEDGSQPRYRGYRLITYGRLGARTLVSHHAAPSERRHRLLYVDG
jgi:Type II/IV secretion system protein